MSHKSNQSFLLVALLFFGSAFKLSSGTRVQDLISKWEKLADGQPSIDSPSTLRKDPTTIHGDAVADLCKDPGKIDAITRDRDGRVYVFKGPYYWTIERRGQPLDEPKLIAADWPGLSGDLDAALTTASGAIMLFKGPLVWSFDGNRSPLRAAKEERISDRFPGYQGGQLRAALARPATGDFYLFAEDEVYEFPMRFFIGGDEIRVKKYADLVWFKESKGRRLVGAFCTSQDDCFYFLSDGTYVNERESTKRRLSTGQLWFGC